MGDLGLRHEELGRARSVPAWSRPAWNLYPGTAPRLRPDRIVRHGALEIGVPRFSTRVPRSSSWEWSSASASGRAASVTSKRSRLHVARRSRAVTRATYSPAVQVGSGRPSSAASDRPSGDSAAVESARVRSRGSPPSTARSRSPSPCRRCRFERFEVLECGTLSFPFEGTDGARRTCMYTCGGVESTSSLTRDSRERLRRRGPSASPRVDHSSPIRLSGADGAAPRSTRSPVSARPALASAPG